MLSPCVTCCIEHIQELVYNSVQLTLNWPRRNGTREGMITPNQDTLTVETRSAVKSADRVIDLFELLAGWSQGMAHADIAETLKIPKSSLSQLLKNLIARGYIVYSPETTTYCLGERFAQMARRTSQAQGLVSIVQGRLDEITRATGESSSLNVLHGDETQVVATAVSPQRLVTHMRLGDVAPLYATSGGKAILAFMPERFQRAYLSRVQFVQITPNTLKTAAQVQRQLERIRREHFAEVYEEFTPGIIGFAVPVLSEEQSVLGSVNIALPAVRHNAKLKELAAEVLKHAVHELEAQLKRSLPFNSGSEKPSQSSRLRKVIHEAPVAMATARRRRRSPPV